MTNVAKIQLQVSQLSLEYGSSDDYEEDIFDDDDEESEPINDGCLLHAFLPKKTCNFPQIYLEDIETRLLQRFIRSINSLLTECSDPKLASVRLMFEKWCMLQPTVHNGSHFVTTFPKEISSIQPGNSIPIYVRNQNCMLLVTKHLVAENEVISLSTFRCSLPNEVVMSNVLGGPLMTIPETVETILNTGMLASQAFSKHLHDLASGNINHSDIGKSCEKRYHFPKTNDATVPTLVMDWVVGLLVPEEPTSTNSVFPDCFQIQKKFRDQISMNENSGYPAYSLFRRSGMYMALKGSLQLKILECLEGSNDQATLVYKIIMLKILADFADQFTIKDVSDVDLASQLLAKLGRRVQKVEKFCGENFKSPLSEWITKLKIECLNKVATIVDDLTAQMKNFWEKAIASQTNNSSFTENDMDLSTDDYEENLHHHLPELDKFVAKMNDSFETSSAFQTKKLEGPKVTETFERYTTANSIMIASKNLKSIPSIQTWLHDTEYFIKFCCTFESLDSFDMTQLLSCYITTAQAHYRIDPLGQSQIYLVSLKGLEILDKIVTHSYPRLLNYKPEVNLLLFDYLLLPYKRDMTLLNDLVAYFKTRDENASLLGVLSSNAVNADSFSVNFAQQNEEMKILREQILAQMEAGIESKYKEINDMVEKCRSLSLQYKNSDCSCHYELKCGTPTKISCARCGIPKLIKSNRKGVRRYERPLPQNETLQWAVIFELRVPQKYSDFRNYLAYAKYELWGETIFNENISSQLWLSYEGLASFKSTPDVQKSKKNNIIQLASFSRPTCSRRLRDLGFLDIIKDTKESYIIYNGMDCHYFYNGKNDAMKLSIQNVCAFQLNTTRNSEPYATSNLQATIQDTNHTQNCILARQNDCHQKLALEEFLAFGSLRAGHRIQLRNLYQSIAQGCLSLEQESCLALIMQTIWQIGPLNETTNERESHLDFSENGTQFADEFLAMLENLVSINKANRNSCMIFLIVVIITRRIGELHANLQGKCYATLKGCKKVLISWIADVEEALKQETSTDFIVIKPLWTNLFEIVLCLTLSYNIASTDDLSAVLKDPEDVNHWLQTLYQRNELDKQVTFYTSEFFQILWNFGKNVSLCMQLETQVDLIEDGLKAFIEKSWNKAAECTFKSIDFPYRDKNMNAIVVMEYLELDQETQVESITHQITFDLNRGRFMVNGYSSSTCPQEIKSHKLFKRYFKEESNLRVQQLNARLSRTVFPYKGHHYEFHQDCFQTTTMAVGLKGKRRGKKHRPVPIQGHDLVILEIQEGNHNPNKLVLVDPDLFSNSISNNFIENYTHWLDSSNELVYFRPNTSSNDQKGHCTLKCVTSEEDKMWTLVNPASSECVLSMHSTGFKQITQRLERLEMDNNIIVTYHRDNQIVAASLRRYNLQFTLNLKEGNKNLHSVEYSGYNVSTNQTTMGTMIGLQHGLLLENGEKRLILMPHAPIKCSIATNQNSSHQISSICISENLRQPPFFVFEMDDILQRLKPHNSKSAWLYLAALHAVTSSPFLLDPYTELTGTEMAVHILQLACVWSCCPYDEESLKTLNFIRNLSPKRKWHDGHLSKYKKDEDKGSIEHISWPDYMPSMLAYDGYAIIVDKLIEDSEKLAMLHKPLSSDTNKKDENVHKKISEHLCLLGYLRNMSFYSLDAMLEYPKYFGKGPEAMINSQGEQQDQQLQLRVSSTELNVLKMQHISYSFLAKSIQPLMDSGIFQKKEFGKILDHRLSSGQGKSPNFLELL